MNTLSWDLNLLIVFDALMTERHLTRASERIGLSQPATSNALARLRKMTQNELFIRREGTFQPTPVAISLAEQIQPALQQIDAALAQTQTFNPVTSDRTFRIGMSDYTAFTLLPRLLKTLQLESPHVAIQVRTGERGPLLKLLDTGELDLLCGLFPEKNPSHISQKLFEETFVGVCRQGHPNIDNQLSLQQYTETDHLLVSVAGDRIGRVDRLLSQQNLSRHVAVTIPHFLVVPFILAQTNLVATLAKRVAESFVRHNDLKVLPLPLTLKGFSVSMRWHRSNTPYPEHIWLRSQMENVSRQLSLPAKE